MFYQLERSLRVRGLNEVPREAPWKSLEPESIASLMSQRGKPSNGGGGRRMFRMSHPGAGPLQTWLPCLSRPR